MREDLRQLSAEIRIAIVERLCTQLDLDEDDLRRSFLILGCKFFQLNSDPAS